MPQRSLRLKRLRAKLVAFPRGSTREHGQRGEDRAVAELVRRGYVVVARNYRCRLGEIDLIARDGDVLVFIEVRSRADKRYGTAAETVGRAKQRTIARVAQHYLTTQSPNFTECRFDVVAITAGELSVFADAFRL